MALKINQQKTMCSYAILFLVVWLGMAVWNGKFDSSIKMLHQMKQDGLMLDVVTYSTLLAGCIKVKHGYSKALGLVRELQHNGLHMDSVIYGTLLAVCASNTKLEEAESCFNWMKDEGHSPNVFHYSSLLNCYSISGNYRKADELVQDMKSAELVPNKVYLQGLAVWQLRNLCLCTPRGT